MILRYTFLTEGSTDAALLPILDWTIQRHTKQIFTGEFVYRRGQGLADKIHNALEDAPCDLLFIHRDSDREEPIRRYEEIQVALTEAKIDLPSVCVVPVRMMEAWLLFDSGVLRQAAGNRNSRSSLNLPTIAQLETIADPKTVLREALRTASEHRGRRLEEFNKQIPAAMRRITQLTDDFSPLLRLRAFQRLQDDVRTTLEAQGWYKE
ncbi:DUF4276 family protein [Armatimonas sp.]|uniref:DUF4276 family protein n=1 Tax=Armatimonas sp. TaxID=1872638 RepID=UPI00286A63BD|nr:DUF4276 family protein [Armatimonas sp.]